MLCSMNGKRYGLTFALRPTARNSIAAGELYYQHWHVRCRARYCLWSQQSTLTLMNANMANLRWRCVDLTSLAIAFSKRDPLVEMGFQRVCTTIEIIIIITLFGATSRIEDDGLGSVRSMAPWLSL